MALSFVTFASAQTSDSASGKKTYLKANALFLPIGMLNLGLEHQLGEKWTLQGEVFVSPWKSFMGKYAQIYMGGVEGRYYFNEAFKHWYVGGNLHFSAFNMQKWSYWSDRLAQYDPNSPFYRLSDLYQRGFSIMLGATIGYQWQINNQWNLDLFVGGGHSEGFYHGYVKGLDIRYDDAERPWNRSGEFIPYKGGLMIAYRLK